MRFSFFHIKEVAPMQVLRDSTQQGTQQVEAEELSKKIVNQAIAVSIGYQEAMRSFTKARIAFYGAWAMFGLNMVQATLVPFLDGDKKE
jgi:hypothetical protein